MKPIDATELKNHQLEILDSFSTFCERESLRYFLAYGTLLGAIRHSGFIPWDDDIDVWMPRPDFERLISSFEDDKKPFFRPFFARHDRNCSIPMAKIHDTRTVVYEPRYKPGGFGIYIDVFPLDGVSSNSSFWAFPVFYHLINAKQALLSFPRPLGKQLAILTVKAASFPLSSNWLARQIDRIARHEPFEESELVVNRICRAARREVCPRHFFERHVYHVFEDRRYRIPVEYDEVLRRCFGNYMQLPPENERISNHLSTAYWKD